MMTSIQKQDSWQMFNEISPKYDLLNGLLSFGIDHHWRRTIIKHLSLSGKKNILDLATGTGDVLLTLIRHEKRIIEAVGIDLANNMLEIGLAKIAKQDLTQRIQLLHGDAAHIPFENGYFENVTIAFGIRNVSDTSVVLKEMHRVLTPNGRAIILEFSLPENPILRMFHLFYLRTLVPCIGGLVSGHAQAYRYLNQTIETFPYGEAFCRLLREAGFAHQRAHPLMGGIATIYVGEK